MTFEEYYKSYGFLRYPFGIFTSEGEKADLSSLFVKPPNYSVILEGLKNTSAIVTGERGTGKTALSLDLQNELETEKNLIVRIEEYSSLEENFDEESLYQFLTENIAAEFFMRVAEHPSILWRYTKEEKIDLSMYLNVYVSASSKEQLREKINKIQNGIIKRTMVGIYNFSRVALNYGLKAATKAISDAITKHFSSLPEFDLGNAEYFQKIEGHIDESFDQKRSKYYYLTRLCKLIQMHRFSKIYIIVDKIDEDARFENDAENIADFANGFASNNRVLTHENFHFLLFLWSTPFNYIKSSVRTQKLMLEKLEWSRGQLEQVVGQRISTFSNNKINSLSQIIQDCSQDSIDLLFSMCNGNPRDLWHILNHCFRGQYSLDATKKIGDASIASGVKSYIAEFNYYEYYPKKSKSRTNSMDIYSYIKHLLKLNSHEFTKDRLNAEAGTGSSTNNYVVAMENIGLIRKTSSRAQGGAVIYEIRDPKVRYAMENKISIDP